MNPGESLWLNHEPPVSRVKSAFDDLVESCGLENIQQIVFCGYGEPMCRATDVIELTRYFKQAAEPGIRLNTNGLVRLMFPDFDMETLAVFDEISISLNADTAEEYLRLTRPKHGIGAFNEMLSFAEQAKKYSSITLSIVNGTLDPQRVANCRKIAADMGVPLKIR
jgi:TatD family-associated radical SAM protein